MSEPAGSLYPELPPREPAPQEILNLPLPDGNDAEAATIGEYLIELLVTLWREQDEFSGKRPFGNSSWEFDIYGALGRAGIVQCDFDEDGYLAAFPDSSRRKADGLILAAIHALGEPPAGVTR